MVPMWRSQPSSHSEFGNCARYVDGQYAALNGRIVLSTWVCRPGGDDDGPVEHDSSVVAAVRLCVIASVGVGVPYSCFGAVLLSEL